MIFKEGSRGSFTDQVNFKISKKGGVGAVGPRKKSILDKPQSKAGTETARGPGEL